MRQVKIFSDERLNFFCAYCGGETGTKDHVPSKILLDLPYPEQLPVVPACKKCNKGFSFDEAYFACLIECARIGETAPEKLSRSKISELLKKNYKIKELIEKSNVTINGVTQFTIEERRVKNVLIKLGKGHFRYENSDSLIEEPDSIWYKTIDTMSQEEISLFFENQEQTKIPEIGSRASQQLVLNESGMTVTNWKEVQKDKYEFSISFSGNSYNIKILLWNYLVCELVWNV